MSIPGTRRHNETPYLCIVIKIKTMCITRASYNEGKNEPVTVYKVIECHTVMKPESTEAMVTTRKTPFRGVILSEDILNGTVPFVAEGDPYIAGIYIVNGKTYAREINGGYIHTYAAKQSVVKDYFDFYRPECEKDQGVKVEIYECEIPAGEGYWEGLFDGNMLIKSTASKSIVFKRRLSQEEIRMSRY